MSVWDDIADSREEAENLKLRAALIRAIRDRIDEAGWSQSIAAQNLGLTQPRVSDLYRGKISKFSLDALVEIASKLGIHVRVEVDADTVLSA
jgi:predicted XRE-type DNA-binding protein